MVRAGAGAAMLAAPAVAVPLVRKARRTSGRVGQAVDQAQDAVGRVSDAAGTANQVGQAVAPAAQAIGKIGGAISGRGGGRQGSQAPKLSHLIEQHFDIAVPRSVVYNQWTQLEMFPTITKGVESVEQQDDDKAQWTSKIGPSRRSWTGRITEQVPDERIVWKSEGGVATEGVVSFHDVGDGITRVMLEMEYHPRGAFEWTGNTLRVQRRRVKRDLRLFKAFLEMRGEETGGWRGRIEDGEVVDGDQHDDGRHDDGKGRAKAGGGARSRSRSSNGGGQGRQQASSGHRSGGNNSGGSSRTKDQHDEVGAGGEGEGEKAPSGSKDSGTKDSGTKDSGTKDSGSKDSGSKDKDHESDSSEKSA